MKVLLCSITLLCSPAFALDELVETVPKSCSVLADCPAIPCHTATACVATKCQYSTMPKGTLCPKQGCSNGGGCDDDANDVCNDKGVCQDTFFTTSHQCTAGDQQCVLPAYCDGVCGKCPSNGFAGTSVTCKGTSTGGACDAPNDLCDGKGNCVDQFLDSSHQCDAGSLPCKLASTCDGKTSKCPANGFAGTSVTCKGTCDGGPCDAPNDLCDGKGNCVDQFLGSSHQCDAGSPPCKLASTCDGKTSKCPPNGFAGTSVTCTGTSNGSPCDGTDLCDGSGNCVDKYYGSNTLCCAGATYCDANYFCDGTCGKCPNPPSAFTYLEKDKVSMATYLSDTVSQCSAKAVSVGSERLMSAYTSTSDNLVFVMACVAAVAVVATAMLTKKSDRFVSMEDGYSRLAEDLH